MNRRSYPRGLSVFVSEEMDDTIRAIHARDGGGLSDVIRDLLDEALTMRSDREFWKKYQERYLDG